MKQTQSATSIKQEIKDLYTWLDDSREYMDWQQEEFDKEYVDNLDNPDFDEDEFYNRQEEWIDYIYDQRRKIIKRIQKLYMKLPEYKKTSNNE